MNSTDDLLVIDGVTKAYPGVVANSDVSFRIRKGEVHALLGENGAGKSTLVKTIYGLVTPDAGTMTLDGQAYAPAEPSAARQAGVAMVFQHFSLFDALSVAENIALGMETPPKRRVLARQIREVSEAYGLPLSPNRRVGDLSAGERQRVEIVRCLLQNPRLLIMDEPTSVLTPQEVEILFRTLRQLSAEGTAILYISHKLDEIRALCDTATILRHGKVVGDCVPRDTSARDMAEMMVAAKLDTPVKHPGTRGEEVFAVDGLSLPAASQFGTALKDIAFSVRKGEILGIGGVAGNGQDELFAVLSGETRTAPGSVAFQGAPVGRLGPHERRAIGILSAPEERLGHAAAPDMSLADNALMTAALRMKLAPGGWIDWKGVRAYAEKVIKGFDVRTPGAHTAAGALSGGNLQKFVVGREVMQDPALLIVNQPTWGVDAAAAAHIRKALIKLAEEGAALIVISQDLDELMEISDRITAICDGRMVRPRPAQGLTMNDLGLMLGGRDPEEEAVA
ncbi:ABC transporter ATP-binding protein [Poseidonocella sp. HB161398]|uniref:ABC transporter ATP-binding protein n=1 Tax=Poseidonocella sp. HB161398 TaxID=2320855 RepID=UPI0011099A57|nr:ABC transporter ATP-binding protein [Poseidonocella sp. HB161398]